MPYKQIFHSNEEYNNKFISKPLMYDGDGLFDSLVTTIANNKDIIKTGVKIASVGKDVYDVVKDNNNEKKQIQDMKNKNDLEIIAIKKILDLQKKVKNESTPTTVTIPTSVTNATNSTVISYDGNRKQEEQTSSLNPSQLSAFQLLAKKSGNGLKIIC